MKWIITRCAALLITASVFAQAPEKMSYQAVVRNGDNNLVTSSSVGIRISILQGSANGTAVYVERQTPTSNTNGLVSMEIGAGTSVSGTFNTIDWSAGPYFIKTETDPTGGTNYTITGTSQLLSVPYALHAKTAEKVSGTITETDPIYKSSQAANIAAGDNTKLSNLSGTNTGDQDLSGSATKTTVTTSLNGKVDKATGKDLVSNGTTVGQMRYWNGTAWVIVAAGKEGQVLTFLSGVPRWKSELEPGEVENPLTGRIWMDRNLGASQVATSSTDEAAYGDLYQWGRGTDGHQIRTSATTATLSSSDTSGHGKFIISKVYPYDWRSPQNTNLWQGVNGVNNPCPSGYRLPTDAEWEAELTTWSVKNSDGAFASPLKLPMAYSRFFNDGSLDNSVNHGNYWCSTVYGVYSPTLFLASNDARLETVFRVSGQSVRCIKD